MADSYTEVSYNSFGGRLMKSVGGAVVGLLLAVLSVPVLYWNEGRTNFAEVAQKATVLGAPAGSVELASVTGPLGADAPVGDPEYLKPGGYVALYRRAEMYAWREAKREREEKQLGGSSKTVTTYEYDLGWTRSPSASGNFRHPEGHENPEMRIGSQTFYARGAHVGAFAFDPSSVELPRATAVPLSTGDLVGTGARGHGETGGDYLFFGRGSLSSPSVGDERIAFEAVRPGATVTLFGRADGAQLSAATVAGNERFFRVLEGDRAQAIAALQTEHSTTTWALRLVGFLMMWFGSAALFGPLNTFLDIVPIAGSAGRFLVTLALAPITFVISALVIGVSMVAHSLIAMATVAILSVVALVVFLKLRRPAI